MEEHPSKRRRVKRTEDRPNIHHGLHKRRERGGSLGDRREHSHIPKLVLPTPEDRSTSDFGSPRQQTQGLREQAKIIQREPTRLQPRNHVPSGANSRQSPPQAASTVLAIAIENGHGVVSEMNVPVESKSVWLPGYGMLTMNNAGNTPTTITQSGSNPGDFDSNNPARVTPPPAVAASQARNQALQTQEAIAKQLNVVPQGPSSAEPAQRAAASQSPMAANNSESLSQQILSLPPTPIPTTPQSSAGLSASSYFSPSPASMPSSTLPQPSTSSSPPFQSTTSSILTPSSALILETSQLPSTLTSTSSASTSSTSTTSTSLLSSSLSLMTSEIPSSLSPSITSQASLSSTQSLSASASTTTNPTGFITSTRNNQSSLTRTSTENSTRTSISSAATSSSSSSSSSQSQLSTQSSTATSLSGAPSSTEGVPGGVGGPGNTATAPSPTSSSNGGTGGSNAPPTPVLVGGIVGGVAGLTMLLALLLLFLRWRRGKAAQRRNISPPIPQSLGPGGVPQSGSEAGNMTQRSSTTPIAGAGFFGRLRPTSAQTATTADTAPSERGFQKISGRKLPSVLASGGDGYGDAAAAAAAAGPSREPPGSSSRGVAPGQGPSAGLAPPLRPSTPRSLSGSSFYRDSQGFYGGTGPETTQAEIDSSSSPSTSPSYPTPLAVPGRLPQGRGNPSNRPPEVANMRPGPARTPVINQPGRIPVRTPSRANQPPPRPERGTPPPPQNPSRDGLGRSHPSQDGSRGSRFREDTTPP